MENNNAVVCKPKEQKESTEELVPPHLHNIHAKWVPSCQKDTQVPYSTWNDEGWKWD